VTVTDEIPEFPCASRRCARRATDFSAGPAHQQARVGPEADECFAPPAVAELTSASATKGYPFESGSLGVVPTAGQDYPGSYGELLAWFPDDHACIDYLEWLRWPDGFRCPRCVSRAGWRLSCGPREGTVCGRQRSVTAGTIFQRTRTPLPTWFAAGGGDDLPEAGSLRAWASAGAGARVLPDGAGDAAPVSFGDGAFRSAACEWLGGGRGGVRRGVEGDVHGRETATKSIVAIAVEIKQPKGLGRIRLQSVDDV